MATAGRGKPRQTDRHSRKRPGRHAEANSNYTCEVYKTHGSTSMGWDTFSILASSFFGVTWPVLFWSFVFAVRIWDNMEQSSSTLLEIVVYFHFFFWPHVGYPCSRRCFHRFSVISAWCGFKDGYPRFGALSSIFYVGFVCLIPRIFGSIRLYRAVWYSQLGLDFAGVTENSCWRIWRFTAFSGRPLWRTCCDLMILMDRNVKQVFKMFYHSFFEVL